MEPILTFIGNYWWLAFPLAIVGGGALNALDNAAKRRHKRRLELMAAKRELRAVDIEARVARRELRQGGPKETPLPHKEQLERIFAEHDGITKRWLDYELDVAKLIAFPAMSDGRQPLTAAFLRAKRVADGLRPSSATEKVPDDAIAQYREAVHDYAVAFDIAEQDARRLRDSTFTVAERNRLGRAQQLLKIALDESATQAERNVAYRRVRQEIDGLIVLSDDAVVKLEERVAMQLGTASTPVQQPQSAATAPVETSQAETPRAESTPVETPLTPPPASSATSASPSDAAKPWPVPHLRDQRPDA